MHRRAVADDLADVGPAIAWADALAAEAGVSQRIREDLQVCLEEALANLILHGVSAGAKDIELELQAEAAGVIARISDACAPFDVASAEAGAVSAERSGGAGLRLLQTFPNSLTYVSEGGRNVLTMKLADG